MRLKDVNSVSNLVPMYNQRTALHLQSAPGIGKSMSVRTWRDTLSATFGEEFGFIDQTLTNIESMDVRGFLVPSKDEEGNPVSFFTRSGLMPTQQYLDAHPRGILFLDERSQSNMDVQKAIAPVVLERRFGDHYLPEGWWIVCASNRMEDKSGVVRPPMHLINRERTIEIDFDIDSWRVWAEANNVHPMGIAFARQKPGIFASHVPTDPKPFCTPRSLVSACELITEVVGKDSQGRPSMDVPIENYIYQEMVAGDIGEGTAAEFFAFAKCKDELPTIEEIEANPQGCKAPERLDAAYAGVQLCVHHAKADTIDKLWTWIERLPKELQTSAATSLIENTRAGGTALLNSKALGKWMANNRALIVNTNAA